MSPRELDMSEVSCSRTDLSRNIQTSSGPLYLHSSACEGKGSGVDQCTIVVMRELSSCASEALCIFVL